MANDIINEGRHRPHDDRYIVSIWHRIRRDRYAVTALLVVLMLLFVAYLAPILANDKPIVMRWQGRVYYPALAEVFPFHYFMKYDELRGMDFGTVRDDRAVAVWKPLIPYSPTETSLADRLRPPSRAHWMGTDHLGRDVASRMIHGARVSLRVGLIAVSIALAIGMLLGSIAGFYGGVPDMIISRVIEVVMCFPVLFLILAVIAFLPPSIYNIMIVIGLTRWTAIARYTRGEFLRLKQRDFAYAAKAIGVRDRGIIVKHLLPNSLAPVLVSATFGVANAILIEAALSFLGLGVQPPMATWGGILALSQEYIGVAWWLATIPGIAIFVTVTAYNMLGEGIRDAVDPRHTIRATH